MHILVVDDELDIQSLFEQRFRREIRNGDFSFHFSHSGEEALPYLDDHSSEVVLILSDINMPGMTGFELLRRIRTKPFQPPPIVMMITAYGDEQSHQQAIELGANDFLNKPLDFNNLREKLKTMV